MVIECLSFLYLHGDDLATKMDCLEDYDFELLNEDVLQKLRKSSLLFQLKKIVQTEFIEASPQCSDYGNIMKKPQVECCLRNFIFNYLQQNDSNLNSNIEENIKEPVVFLRLAQTNWEKRIIKSINSMSAELGVPLARRRTEKEQREVLSRWSELGANEPDLSKFRPVYAAKDFLEVITNLRNPNVSENCSSNIFLGLVQIPFSVESLEELQERFKELHIKRPQAGIDDQPGFPPELFSNDRIKLAAAILDSKLIHYAQEYIKQGCPMSYRYSLWKQALNVSITGEETLEYDCLKQLVVIQDLLTDALIYKDVKMTATNDDQYFVFEDYLYQVLLPFSRDIKVLQCFEWSSATPAVSYLSGNLGSKDHKVNYPPNGIVPYHGFSMYVAPLCYVYNDPVHLYFVFRELYIRHFYKLHTLSSSEEGIVSLCVQFEHLLQHYETNLFFHLKTIGLQPLKVAFKWMIRGFSGFLASEQVLHLWDRMIGYNSLAILPVTAAAIFSFRKVNLMQVKTSQAAEAIMADLLTLEAIPLIQLFLFAGRWVNINQNINTFKI